MKVPFELDLPEGAVDESAQAGLVRTIKEQAVLNLYAGNRITTGEAAETMGLTRIGRTLRGGPFIGPG